VVENGDVEENNTNETSDQNSEDSAANQTESNTTENETEDMVQSSMEFVDGMGRTVVLDAYPESVISISANTTEIIYAIGAGDLLIGRDAYSLFPPEVENVEIVGDFFSSLPSEALLAAEPDLIIAGGIISEEQITTMEELGLTVYYQLDPVDFDGLYANIADIGALLGYETQAAELNTSLEARVAAVLETLAGVEEKPVVFVELDATDPANPWTTGSGTFVDYILTSGGGQNAAAALTGSYAQMSSEALIEADPDVILLTDAFYGITPESVGERAGWEGITAVVDGAVFPFDPYLFSVPGPRLVDGLELVAQLLHPDLFE
jgi:iron complex transport system substrate-binding protein